MLVKDIKKGDKIFCVPVWISEEVLTEFQFEIYEVKTVKIDVEDKNIYCIKLIPILGVENPYLVLPGNTELNDIVATKYADSTWIWTTNEDLAVKLFEAFSEDKFERIGHIYFYLDGYYDMSDVEWYTNLEAIYK